MEEKFFGKKSIFELLSELENYKSENSDMLTIYIAPKSSLPEIPSTLKEKIEKIESPTGLVIFSWEKEGKNIVIFPPFPVEKNEFFCDKIFRTEQLKNLLLKEYKLGIILMRLGEYAVGIFEGNKQIVSKCGKRLVRGKHKKGGYSQARFARIREVQINQFFKEVYNVLREKLGPYLENLDYIIYGGPKITIKKFQKIDHFLRKISEKTLDRILDVREVNKKTLENILKEVWKIKVLFL